MTSTDNKEVVRRYLEEIVNTGNTDTIASFISPEYTEVFEGERRHLGIEGAKDHVTGVRGVYPDLKVLVGLQIGEGEWVATSVTAVGTHRGTWMGIRPTGKRVTFTGVNIDRVVGGRIVEHGGAANMLHPLIAVGAVRIVGEIDG